jgi:cell division protein FtsZ
VQAIAELITRPGLVNVDFSHVRSLMQLAGGSCLAVGHVTGPDKAILAVRSALHNPMLEIGSLETAAGLLVHFTGGEDMELAELNRAMQEAAADAANAEVFFGAAIDPAMKGRVQAIIVATGVGGQPLNSVISGASHILLKHTQPEGQPAPVAFPASRLSVEPPAPISRRPIAQLLQQTPARSPNLSRPIVPSAPVASRSDADQPLASTIVEEDENPEAICAGEDLEIPAFLRRRIRPSEPQPSARSFHTAA